MKRFRSAIKGRFVTRAYARRHPRTTVGEAVEPGSWAVVVTVPPEAPPEWRELLFDAVADAVAAIEPVDRDGWDLSVTGGPS